MLIIVLVILIVTVAAFFHAHKVTVTIFAVQSQLQPWVGSVQFVAASVFSVIITATFDFSFSNTCRCINNSWYHSSCSCSHYYHSCNISIGIGIVVVVVVTIKSMGLVLLELGKCRGSHSPLLVYFGYLFFHSPFYKVLSPPP